MFLLKENPFFRKTVVDYNDFKSEPFIVLPTQKTLLTGLELSFGAISPLYYLIKGERGSGKTSTLFLCKEMIDKHGGNLSTFYVPGNEVRKLKEGDIYLNKIITGKITNDSSSNLKKFFEIKKPYFFLDFPDMITRSQMADVAEFIEYTLRYKKCSLIVAMNTEHYNIFEDISLVLGKFMPFNLETFSLEETTLLIKKRLKKARTDDKVGETYPFTKEALKEIHYISNGIPRNVLIACDICLMKAIELKRNKKLDREFVSLTLKKTYFENVLREKIGDESRRVILKYLYQIIRDEFEGHISSISLLHNFLKKKKGKKWAYSTLRKWVLLMEKIGIVSIDLDPETFREKTINLRI
ncbi:MAG: hypothetical protein ACE5K4_10685 [Candidatus Hydrothermarchaeota archaeon]